MTRQQIRLTVFVSACSILGPFSIDLQLPAFPEIQDFFGVNTFVLQTVISGYLVGVSLGSLVAGFAADIFGRRSAILVSLACFALASLGCALADTFNELIFWRFLQGLAAAGSKNISRVIVTDSLGVEESRRVLGYVGVLFGAGPAFAPLLGGWLLEFFGWRSTFGFTAAVCLLTIVAYFSLLGGSYSPPANNQTVRSYYKGFSRLFFNGSFLARSAVLGLNFVPIFLFIISAPVIVEGHWGLGKQHYGWVSIPAVVGLTIGGYLGSIAARHHVSKTTLVGSVTMLVGACLSLVLSSENFIGFQQAVALAMIVVGAGSAMSLPAITVSLLDVDATHKGAASSLSACISLLVLAAASGIVQPAVSAEPWSLYTGILLSSFIVLVVSNVAFRR